MRHKMDEILNECIERLLAGENIEACLKSHPAEASELEPLLLAASRALHLGSPKPRPEFAAALRSRLLSEFETRREKRQRWGILAYPRLRPWLATASAIIVLLLLGGGTVRAASRSLPDQPLYPVKQAVERVQLAITPSGMPKARLYAKLARARSDELIEMAKGEKPELVEKLTQRLRENLERSQVHIGALPPAEVATVTDEGAPAPPQPRAEVFLATPPLAKPTIQLTRKGRELEDLKELVKRNSERHQERLREVLEKAPPPARTALEKSLRASGKAYGNAIQALEKAQEQERESQELRGAPGP